MSKVKVGKTEYSVKPITLDERCKINDLVVKNMEEASFSFFVDVVRKATELSDEDINNMNSDDIVILAGKCVDRINKKK